MLIYLDTKDLIDILEKARPCSTDQFRGTLTRGGHTLVLSIVTVMELSAPLLHKSATTNVMRLLNLVESLPHIFIHSAAIPKLELAEAMRAFTEGAEYVGIMPFERRFDQIVDMESAPPTRLYLNYSLPETIWDLYHENAITRAKHYDTQLKKVFMADRSLSPKPSLRDSFIRTIERSLKGHHVNHILQDVRPFADWIYSNPLSCPSIKLGYEVFHKMIKNVTDEPTGSDIEDFQHIHCLPYVDAITIDRTMHGYVLQADSSMGLGYRSKTFRSVKELLEIIGFAG